MGRVVVIRLVTTTTVIAVVTLSFGRDIATGKTWGNAHADPPTAPAQTVANRPAAPDSSAPGAAIAAIADIPDVDVTRVDGVRDTWRELPQLAARAREAARRVAGSAPATRAWGDPTLGCFALAARFAGGSPALHRSAHEALTSAGIDIGAARVAETATAVTSRFGFASAGWRGIARLVSATSGPAAPATALVACFYSQRAPTVAARLCEQFLQQVSVLEMR